MSVTRFNDYLGIEVTRLPEGRATAHLDLDARHLNSRGVVHGGVVASLLDNALGSAVLSSIPQEWRCATISLSVQFLEAAREGRLVATSRILRKGKRVAFAEGEVRDEAGRLVAAAQGSFHLWPYHPEMETVVSEPYVVMRGTGERIRVGKIVAVGRNYADHVAEMGVPETAPRVIFFKPPSAIVHDGGHVRIPPDSGKVHHEVEMVAVVAKAGKSIPEERALEHVLGYAVGLDMTLRDLQARAKERGEPWALAKGFDTSAPVSLVAPRDEVGDGSGLGMSLHVNGACRQEASTSSMIRTVAALVAEISRRITLERGDLLFTGTPSGVGPVEPGDLLEARLEKVGTLTVHVIAS